jgi:hypothetical protein
VNKQKHPPSTTMQDGMDAGGVRIEHPLFHCIPIRSLKTTVVRYELTIQMLVKISRSEMPQKNRISKFVWHYYWLPTLKLGGVHK